jgi:hypothetical protein
MARAWQADGSMFPAAMAANGPAEGLAGPLALALFTIDAETHFFEAPSGTDFDGGGMNP